ncbi:peroxidase-related enzyme [Roseomonas elaeocarpi]|uniref:Peroxidase-related enzyme n=1 Tax=Roseomonas elaeocarpi TaxID=907779 RepID=A0ABV6JMS8_9PROT
MSRFTMDVVDWEPRVSPVEIETATPEQMAALEACPPAQRTSVYFRTLVNDPGSLSQRGALFTKVMYAPRGLPRAERELATAAVSIVNGCIYCTSVHARRYVELKGPEAAMRALLAEGVGAVGLDARQQAIVDYAAKMTARPQDTTSDDLKPLRAAGFNDLEILDLIHAVAMFANANRLMQALGRSVMLDPT